MFFSSNLSKRPPDKARDVLPITNTINIFNNTKGLYHCKGSNE